MSEVITAATGLACLDKDYPHRARVALAEVSLSIQNPYVDWLNTLTPYVAECPDTFFDVAELEQSNVREDDLLELLLSTRDRKCVREVVKVRIIKWLGCWTWQSQLMGRDFDQESWQAARELTISGMLSEFLPSECDAFNAYCLPVPGQTKKRLLHAAAILMAGRPHEQLATGLIAWAFVQAVAPTFMSADSASTNLAWVVRLNQIDYHETKMAVVLQVEKVIINASERCRWAAATALRLIGTFDAAARAMDLAPIDNSQFPKPIMDLCDTNPYDPCAPIGSNLSNARIAAANIDGSKMWIYMGSSAEKSTLAKVTPALARFDAPIIVNLLLSTINSIKSRTQTALRQLSWQLPGLSPLFGTTEIDSVTATYERLIHDPDIVEGNDLTTVANNILTSLMPHFDAEAQLVLLLKLPHSVGESLDLWRVVKNLQAERLEQHLNEALHRPTTPDLRRVLLFACGRPARLSDRARQIVAEQINNEDTFIAGCAAQVAYVAQDDRLDRLITEQAKPYKLEEIKNVTLWRQHAIAAAVITQKRADLLHLVAPQLRGHVAIVLGDQAYQASIMAIEHVFNRLLQSINISKPLSAKIFVSVSHDGKEVKQWMEHVDQTTGYPDINAETPFGEVPDDLNEAFHKLNQLNQEFDISYAQDSFLLDLLIEDANELVFNLEWRDAILMVQQDAVRLRHWINQILAIKNKQILCNIYNFGIVLAGAYAIHDATAAIKLLEHLHDANPIVTIVVGEERIPLYLQTLFKTAGGTAAVAELDPLRERFFAEAFTDAELETGVISADACGASIWLDAYMSRLLGSRHPGEQARGLTIAGLRSKNSIAQNALAKSWGSGFLGDVASNARKIYQKNEWANHWFALAAVTDNPIDFWRYGQLAQGIVDRRFNQWVDGIPESPLLQRFGGELLAQLKTAAEKRSDKRKNTLFGLKAPDQNIRFAMLN